MARALYKPQLKAADLSPGLTLEDFADDPRFTCHVWHFLMPIVAFFERMATQWRMSPSGPVGLDYNVLFSRFELEEIPKEKRRQLDADIRLMEQAALAAIWEQNK